MSFRSNWFEEASGYCGRCLSQAPVGRRSINHTPHLLLTLVTCGVWAVFWVQAVRSLKPWKCLKCGAAVYKLMSTRLESDKKRR
ncbi:MAG: hypothetical protein JSU94_16270 [Phycisphaerales bacterium]|nr:MAG: hypothetical protein JSU94_16270 [Phycisphaerales bacterium]